MLLETSESSGIGEQCTMNTWAPGAHADCEGVPWYGVGPGLGHVVMLGPHPSHNGFGAQKLFGVLR